MDETHICIVDREGAVVHEAKAASSPSAIASALSNGPQCRRVIFECGRMASMLYYGLLAAGFPITCIKSRQAYQALKALATHKIDRNDARGLAHLARTGFFKPVHVKSLSAHAVRSLIIARKKLVGLAAAFVNQAIRAGDGVEGLSAALRGLLGARGAVLAAVAAIDADMKRMVRRSDACRRLMTIPGVGQLTALALTAAVNDVERFKRSRDLGPYLGLVPRRYQSGEIDYAGSISKCGDRRGRTLLYEAANVLMTRYKGPLKLKDWCLRHRQAFDYAQSSHRPCAPIGHHHARYASPRHRLRHRLSCLSQSVRRPQPAPERSDARGREWMTAWIS